MRKRNTKVITTLAMLAAVSILLVWLIHFPLIPVVPFMEYDPADIPIFISGFLFGPWIGLGLTVAVSLLQGLTVSAASGGIIGILMHILATGSFVMISGFFYEKKKTRVRAAIGLAMGTLTMTIVMCGCNLVFTPIFMKVPMEMVASLLIPGILPFNLLKAGINALITWFIYKPISSVVHKEIDNHTEQ